MNKLFFSLFFLTTVLYAQEKSDKIDYKYKGAPYYPEQFLSKTDSLNWPIVFDISVDFKDIKGLNVNAGVFIGKLLVSSYSTYGKEYITQSQDTISLRHDEFFDIYIKENNFKKTLLNSNNYLKSDDYEYLFYDDFISKQVKFIEGPFDHNWNLKNFPFDIQELKFKFVTTMDTSTVKLRASKKFESTFNKIMENLEEGYHIESISHNYKYNTDESDLILVSPGNTRGIVTETLEVILKVNRQGSWLFLKLFTGSILSFLISCLVFLIPVKKEFEAKVTLAVGAIFGAIGNRYFVASALPGVQVFTKADAISNLVIFMVVFNMLIMILQYSDKNYFKYFQSPKNALYYSIYAFIILLITILIW